MARRWVTGVLLGVSACSWWACAKRQPGRVYFANLTDGATVESPLRVEMKAEDLVVEPASAGITPGHGHFHIIIDKRIPSLLDPIVKDSSHLHFGQGESEATLALPPGDHKLLLLFAKGDHVPYDPPIFQEITVHVIPRALPVPASATGSAKADSIRMAGPADTAKPTSDTAAGKDAVSRDSAKAKVPDTSKPAAKDTAAKAKH